MNLSLWETVDRIRRRGHMNLSPWETFDRIRRRGHINLSPMGKCMIQCIDLFNVTVITIINVMNDSTSQWKWSQKMESFSFNPDYVCGVLPSYFMEEIHFARIEDEICFTCVRNSTSFTLVPL